MSQPSIVVRQRCITRGCLRLDISHSRGEWVSAKRNQSGAVSLALIGIEEMVIRRSSGQGTQKMRLLRIALDILTVISTFSPSLVFLTGSDVKRKPGILRSSEDIEWTHQVHYTLIEQRHRNF
jgi:hypothetical protein